MSIQKSHVEGLGFSARHLFSPLELVDRIPSSSEARVTVAEGRRTIHEILNGEDDRLMIITGPCSIHDQAAAIEAHKYHKGAVVTVAMDEIEFKQPVFVGDVVSYYTSTHKLGRTSATIDIDVFAQRQFAEDGDFIEVTSARAVMVAIDENNKPTALNK